MLDQRRIYHARVQGYKLTKHHENCAINPYRTRAFEAPVLKYNVIHTAAYERSIEVFVAQTWNALEPEMRNAESLSDFKKMAKKMLNNQIPRNKINLYE